MENPNPRLLKSFTVDVLRRAMMTAASHQPDHAAAMTSIATLYEAYLWLDLGIKFGAYDMAAAEAMMPSILPDLQYYLESFGGWGLFPDLKDRLVRSTTSGLHFFRYDFGYDESAASANQFHLAIMNLAQIAENRADQALMAALVFLDEQRWPSLKAKLPSPSGIMSALAEDYDPWADGYRDLISAGWFPLVSHIENLMNMFEAAQSPVKGSEQAWISFKYEVLQIHSWRFDFRKSELQSRFEQISAMLGRVIAESQFEFDSFSIHVDGSLVEQYVEQLIKRWKQFTAPSQIGVGV